MELESAIRPAPGRWPDAAMLIEPVNDHPTWSKACATLLSENRLVETARYVETACYFAGSSVARPSTARAFSIMSLIARSARSDKPTARKAMSRTSSFLKAATSSGETALRSASACWKKYMGETPKKAASADRCFWVGLSRLPVRSCHT